MKKQFNKITALLIVIIAMFGCEKDLVENNATISSVDSKSQYVDNTEANEVIGKINKLLGNNFTNNSSSDTKLMNSGFGKIQTNSAVKLTDKNGNNTYTFRIDHPKTSASRFYNLVFSGKAGKEIIRLMEYNLSEKFQKHYLLTKKYSKFSGKLRSKTLVNRTDCPEPIFIVNIANIGDNSAAGGGSPDGTSNSGGNYTGGSNNNSTGNQTGGDNGSSGSNGTDGTNGSTDNGGTGTNTGGSGGNTNETDAALIEAIIECIQFGGTWFEGQCIANPRFFRLAVQREISPTTENNPCPQNPFQFLTIVPNTPFESTFMNNLSPEERKWLYESQNTDPSAYYEILNFINGDGITYSNDNEVFVKQFINNAIANSDLKLNFDDSVKSPANIDRKSISSLTTEGAKFNEIYNELIKIPLFKELFVNLFDGAQTRFNVKFEIADIPQSGSNYTTGNTALTLIGTQTNPHNLITIDRNFLLTKSKLDIAKTILHECIHAYLNIKLLNPTIGMSIPNINNLDVKSCINTYYNNFVGNQAQHSFFVNYMIPTMTAILSPLITQLTTAPQRNQVENPTNTAETLYAPTSNPASLQRSDTIIAWNWNNLLNYFCHTGLEGCTAYPFQPNTNAVDYYFNYYYLATYNYVFNP